MKILGISETDNDAGAALLINGKIKYAANEERFSRIKRHKGFPYRTIKWILEESKLKLEDIDRIAIAKFDSRNEFRLYKHAIDRHYKSGENKAAPEHKMLDKAVWYLRNIPDFKKDTRELNEEINSWLKKMKIPRDKVWRVPHHPAHATTAYYYSGWPTALIVTCDGQGLGVTATISEARNGKIKQVHSVSLPSSAGNFYGMVTKVCGYKPNRHEGKITGLAALGKPVPELDKFVRSILEFKDGNIIGHSIYGTYLKAKSLYKKHGRENISYAFQKHLERVLVAYVKHYWNKRKDLKNIVLAGGVFANVRLNQMIKEIPGVKNTFIFPHMADGGLSVGAAAMLEPKMKVQRLKNVYFGPDFTINEIEEALKRNDIKYTKPRNLAKEVAKLIVEGKVVARFDGKMEFGPRALGNRTIMYHTKDPTVNDWLNKNLHRSEFMPFAPVTLKEQATKCYKNYKGGEYASEFMTITFDCTAKMKKQSPAVVHVDGTARPQVISKKINPKYYQIVKEYHKMTGIPSVVNTSFNMHEEPIVCTPDDAIRSFKVGHLDALAIGPCLVINENARHQ